MIQLVFVDVTRFILFLSFSSELCFGIRGHFFFFRTRFFLRATNIRVICTPHEEFFFFRKKLTLFFHVVGFHYFFNLYNFDDSLKSCLVNGFDIVANHSLYS